MTHMSGATVKQFKDALEIMHGVYPYKDEDTRIVSDVSPYSCEHYSLEIATRDETGVRVNLSCDIRAVCGETQE